MCPNYNKILLLYSGLTFYIKWTFPIHTIPNVLQGNKTEDTIQKFKLQKTHMKIKWKEKQIAKFPSQKTRTFSAVIYDFTEVKVFSALQIPSALAVKRQYF